jgi:hypothetical protein
MWNPFKWFSTPKVEGKTMVLDFPAKTVNTNVTFRTRMWVMKGTQIGILNEIKEDSGDFHSVNWDDGTTMNTEWVELAHLRQAKYYEIPDCRRTFTPETAAGMGYGT